MGLYEHLPYANYHELNLDWIIDELKKLPDFIKEEVARQIVSYTIPDDSVTTPKIANLAVTSAKLANYGVTTGKIANLAVTDGKLAANAVKTVKIEDAAVTTPKLADGAVTSSKLGSGSVTTAALNLSPVTLFSANDAYSLTSGTAFQTVGDSFDLDTGLYIAILYVRKGLVSGTPNNQLMGARITADGINALTRGLEIRTYTGPAAASACQTVVLRTTTTQTLNVQAFQNSGQTNADMRFYFQVLKIGD